MLSNPETRLLSEKVISIVRKYDCDDKSTHLVYLNIAKEEFLTFWFAYNFVKQR